MSDILERLQKEIDKHKAVRVSCGSMMEPGLVEIMLRDAKLEIGRLRHDASNALTNQEARAILDSLDFDLSDDEEMALLQEHNPLLFDAYQRLIKIADSK